MRARLDAASVYSNTFTMMFIRKETVRLEWNHKEKKRMEAMLISSEASLDQEGANKFDYDDQRYLVLWGLCDVGHVE